MRKSSLKTQRIMRLISNFIDHFKMLKQAATNDGPAGIQKMKNLN